GVMPALEWFVPLPPPTEGSTRAHPWISENRMPQRRFLIPLALLLGATMAAVSCTDQAPVGVQTPTLLAASSRPPSQPNSKKTGLVACSQSYDSVTKVIGPLGGTLAVGAHQLWVDSLSLTDTVSITAV